jgi:FkbM family methyltransferase
MNTAPAFAPTIVPIGNTGKVCILEDNAISSLCLTKGRLDWDSDFAAIPEVKALRPGDVVVDVGAFIGDTTECFLGHGCEVHAFEPNAYAFLCLRTNCPLAHLHPIALGSGQSYVWRRQGGNIGGQPLILQEKGDGIARTLDSFEISRVAFLKIDVEGFELLVLKGAEKTIRESRPILHIEVNPNALMLFGATPGDLYRRLTSLGYADIREVFRYYNQNWDLLCRFPHH